MSDKKTVKKSEKTDKKKVRKRKVEKKKVEKKKEVKKEVKKKKVRRRTKKQISFSKGKRKSAIARAVVSKGTGRVSINGVSIEAISNTYMKELLKDPLYILGSKSSKINVRINVKGGGKMGQIQAARTAMAKAIIDFFNDEKLKEQFISYDRSLLVDDVRQVEPKKYRGRKARARFQKSYR